MSYILIVRGKDIKPYASQVMYSLRSRDLECFTPKQLLHQARRGTPITRTLEDMVTTARAVVVISSTKLLDNPYALTVIDHSSTLGNLVAVIPPAMKGTNLLPVCYRGFFVNYSPNPEVIALTLIDKIETNL